MAKRKMTPLALVLTLVDGLNSDEIATLADFLRGKQPRIPKSPSVPSASKRSKKASTEGSPATIETEKETVGTAAVCVVPNCGLSEDNMVHDTHMSGGNTHKFHAEIKSKKAGA